MISELWYEREETVARRLLLAPLAKVFEAGAAARRWMYDVGLLQKRRAGAPVISIGNLVAGGAGKTPVVLHVAERLLAAQRRVAVLSRGYGRRGGGMRVVSDGTGNAPLDAALAGDEPHLIARRVPRAVVLVGPRRAELAAAACERFGAQALLLDDGFQHLALARDVDVVVVDAAAPFGNGHLMPRGPLRERPEALRRAQLVWLSKTDQAAPEALETLRRLARDATGRAPVESAYRATDVLDAALEHSRGPDALRERSVFLLAGLARPASFRATLQKMGARIAGEAIFPDHHRFTAAELDSVIARARSLACDAVVCTEKDAVRLAPGSPVLSVRISVEILAGGDQLDAVLQPLLSPEALA